MWKNNLKPIIKTSPIPLFLLAYASLWSCHQPVAAQQVLMPFLSAQNSSEACQVNNLPSQAADPLAQVLKSQDCPTNVHTFRQLLLSQGAQLKTTLVANRGFHNNAAGSFSLFETVSGQLSGQTLSPGSLYFGHFTEANGNTLTHQQAPDKGALMIELISWDARAQVFRFYEMIGNGQQGEWFYRGDTLDIQADLKDFHLQVNPQQPQFGRRLRCSGCHMAGGPIMKELDTPHNDWWVTQRPLPLKQQPDALLHANFKTLVDATHLANEVKAGMAKLEQSPVLNAQKNLQETLRPLFCAEEVNLASDPNILESNAPAALPTEALMDPRLLPKGVVNYSKPDYLTALKTLHARFPETQGIDGDHAWLAPVKARADIRNVELLTQKGLIDRELVADVLAIDPLRPVVSQKRCGLLKTVPEQYSAQWQAQWKRNLAHTQTPEAQQLLTHLQDSKYTVQSHQTSALKRLQCVKSQPTQEVLNWVGHSRQAIYTTEIAKHPRGQIFEPGFRVIFPRLKLKPAQLDMKCSI